MSKLRGTVIVTEVYDRETRIWRPKGATFEGDAGLMRRMERAGAVRIEKARTPVVEDKAKRPVYEDKGHGPFDELRAPDPDTPPAEEATEEEP